MATVGFTTRIGRAPEAVFDQLADVTRNGEWSPGFAGGEKTTPGPIGLGTTYATTAKGIGTMQIRIEAYERPDRIGFVAYAGPMEIYHQFTLMPDDGGTRATQRIEVRGTGARRLMAPVIALMLKRTIRRNTADLTRYLEHARGAAGRDSQP